MDSGRRKTRLAGHRRPASPTGVAETTGRTQGTTILPDAAAHPLRARPCRDMGEPGDDRAKRRVPELGGMNPDDASFVGTQRRIPSILPRIGDAQSVAASYASDSCWRCWDESGDGSCANSGIDIRDAGRSRRNNREPVPASTTAPRTNSRARRLLSRNAAGTCIPGARARTTRVGRLSGRLGRTKC